jgi:CHAT domain-containing protein
MYYSALDYAPHNTVRRNRSTFQRGLFLLVTILLLLATSAAQDRTTQEEAATKLLSEGFQLVAEGSPASLKKAIDKLESARTLLHSLNSVEGEAATLILTGYAYSQLEQHQKAIEQYEQSLSLFREAHIPRGEATVLLHLGLLHGIRGDMQKALDNLDQALAQFRAIPDPQGEMIVKSAMAGLKSSLGKPEELVSYYKQLLALPAPAIPREVEAAAPAEIDVLRNLMNLNLMEEPEKARESLEQLLAVSQSLHAPRIEATALLILGLYYSFELQTKKALEYYEKSLPVFRAEHDPFGEGLALFGICMSHTNARDHQKAADSCAQALEVQRATGNRQAEALTLKQIAIGERARGNLVASQTAIESAIANIESVRTKMVDPDLRLAFFAGSQDYYEFYIDLLMLLHKQRPGEGYDGKALQVTERARARSLLDTLNEANADIRQGVDGALLQRERELQRKLNLQAQIQMQFLAQPHAEKQATAIADEIETLIKELQKVETEIRQKSPHYAALMQPQPLTLKEIQTQVLDPDTLLLEYSLGEERSYLWAVTSTSITSYELPKRAEIETAARRFYDLLNARNLRIQGETKDQRAVRVAQADTEIPGAAVSLSRMVLAPVAGQLGNRRLVIVADDVLHFVPFAALPVAGSGASGTLRQRRVTRPLIEEHEIVNLPSASTLAVIRAEIAGRKRSPRSVAALADPVFMKNDERVKTAKEKVAVLGAAPARADNLDRQLVKATEEVGLASAGLFVPRLPGTRQEAEQIIAMVPANERRLALDFAASRDTATSAELSEYRYVHFSTHGLLNSVHPELSGLVLSLVNERGEIQDGFLRAHEIFNLKLSPEVVVLSACQTGMGKNIRGEGLVSLTRGFMYAGAPRVIVSLWGVSDSGTTELMVRFYRGVLKEGMQPTAALRAAQISLMNDKRWASPYYWAPFTLQGEWR